MSNSVIQIIEIRGYEPQYTTAVFDSSGKESCKQYFERLFKTLMEEMYVYYKDTSFTYSRPEPYTYEEKFYELIGDQLVLAKNFEECHFYERSFYTANHDREDQGIVCFISYSILNSGNAIYSMH